MNFSDRTHREHAVKTTLFGRCYEVKSVKQRCSDAMSWFHAEFKVKTRKESVFKRIVNFTRKSVKYYVFK